MANTIMSAKNSFEEGLLMDLSPDNTQANCMTSALNATLLTFNGNEMLLQNDMGNGRVETARLPEGYIPVGTCEFGDIIYIVSYNPLTDLSQIGCFPSPERNISSEEIYYNGDTGMQSLNTSEFLVLNGNSPTGELKDTSIKKVLIETKKLNPGDKYIVYSTPAGIDGNINCLSDLDKDTIHGNNPKNVKLHIVGIEDSGKITYLDSTTKWYDAKDGNKYYIDSQANKDVNGNLVPDIDSYRNMLLSGWSIFSSKVSGKLAILAELETIKSFSCSYELELDDTVDPESDNGGYKYKQYKIYLYPEWEKNNNDRDLSYVMVTKALFNTKYVENLENTEKPKENYTEKSYGIINKITNNVDASTSNGYEPGTDFKDGAVYIGTVRLPYKQKIEDTWVNITSPAFIYTIDVTPAMNYGRLDYMTVTLEIDFNKVGTGAIEITDWKYHNSETTSILQYGINIYPKPQWEVDSIIILFSDNIGLVGEYKLQGKKSYSGTHVENFGLDGESYNSRFSRINSLIEDTNNTGNNVIKHPGEKVEDATGIDPDKNDGYVKYNGNIHINDARTLYSGWLYLAKIIIHQKHQKAGLTEDRIEYRWFWTNPMFNEYFYLVKDFKNLDFELILNGEALFETNNFYQWKLKELNNLGAEFGEGENHKTNSANVQYIGNEGVGNINMYVNAGLQNNYKCFNLNVADLNNIKLLVYLASAQISYNLPDKQYEFSDSEYSVSGLGAKYLEINNKIIKDGTKSLKEYFDIMDNPSDLTDTTKTIDDGFNVYFVGGGTGEEELKDEQDILLAKAPVLETTLNNCYYRNEEDKKAISLSLLAVLFNKAYVSNIYSNSLLVPVYLPIINSLDDLKSLGIDYTISTTNLVKLAFNSGFILNQYDNEFSGAALRYDSATMGFSGGYSDDEDYALTASKRVVDITNDEEFIEKVWGPNESRLGLFFPVYLGGYYRSDHYRAIMNNSPTSYGITTNWLLRRSYLNHISVTGHNTLLAYSNDNNGLDLDGDGNFSRISKLNAINFLGMKYKSGMAVFNSAFVDTTNSGGSVLYLKDLIETAYNSEGNVTSIGYYDNFAYLLYLILSNAYHKDKRADDKEIDMKNFVRNSNYTVEMLKNIIIKMEHPNDPANKKPHNILVRGIDLKTMLTGFGLNFDSLENGFPDTDPKDDRNTAGIKNINLKLLNFAKNNELKVLLKSLPMSFLNTNADAYILRNGVLQPCKTLANSFYLYSDGQLLLYANKLLLFNYNDVNANLNYLFDGYRNTDYNCYLAGARREKNHFFTDEDKAYNEYLQQLFYHINDGHVSTYMTRQEAELAKENYINSIIYYMPDILYGYSKHYIMSIMRLEPFFNQLFVVEETGSYGENPWRFRLGNPAGVTYMNLKKPGTYTDLPNYKINTYFNLGAFKYENGLAIDSAAPFSNFGFVESLDTKQQCYGGFVRNIIIDLDYQVVQR